MKLSIIILSAVIFASTVLSLPNCPHLEGIYELEFTCGSHNDECKALKPMDQLVILDSKSSDGCIAAMSISENSNVIYRFKNLQPKKQDSLSYFSSSTHDPFSKNADFQLDIQNETRTLFGFLDIPTFPEASHFIAKPKMLIDLPKVSSEDFPTELLGKYIGGGGSFIGELIIRKRKSTNQIIGYFESDSLGVLYQFGQVNFFPEFQVLELIDYTFGKTLNKMILGLRGARNGNLILEGTDYALIHGYNLGFQFTKSN